MPRLKNQSPRSLFVLCAEFVAYNLDRWMCNPTTVLYLSNDYDQEAAKVCSPLDKLPSALIEEVVNLVRDLLKASSSPEKMSLKKQSFELLITPFTKCLDMSIGDPNDVPRILKLASLKCPDMETVRLVDSPSYFLDSFVYICALKFERLQVLDISKTDARDNCLKMLGMYCKGLRKLDLQHCKKITDNGIEGLCVSVNYLGREDQRLGQCKSIETLVINGTEITRKGMYTALVNLPFLKELTIGLSFGSRRAVPVQFLAEIHQPDWNSKRLKDIRKYSLESLYLGDWSLDSEHFSVYDELMDLPYTDGGNLGLVASLCPSVTSVEVKWMRGLTDSDLLGLLCLENVNELKIGGYVGPSSVTFEGGVVPLLKGFQNSLKVLKLTEVKDVNIGAIIDLCPKLKCLSLRENYHDQSKRCKMERKPLALKNLEKLSVYYSRDYYFGEGTISSEDLLSLFSSPSLINIDIFSCPNLTDNVFERASEIHQFLNLEQLTVYRCKSLTRKGIDVVMNEKTPLHQIRICYCKNITDDDIALLISNATSEEWQLSVFYNDYNDWN